HPCAHAADRSLSARRDDQDQRPLERDEMSLNRRLAPLVPAEEPVNLSQLRPHPEEPERSEGVSKDGRESELAAMVRDGALRAPPHHEAERVELVLNRQDLKDSQPRKRGPSSFGRVLGPWIPAFAGMNGDWLNGGANLNSSRSSHPKEDAPWLR